jgi:hypothetical protein
MDSKEFAKIVQATNSAIKKGLSRTEIDWRESAYKIIYELCVTKRELTANDFTGRIKDMDVKTHDNRAIGGLVRTAQAFGWIGKTGEVEVSKAGHLSRIQIWKSLIFGKYPAFFGDGYTRTELGNGVISYKIPGSNNNIHEVLFSGNGWSCDCEAFRYGQGKACKHILETIQKKRDLEAQKVAGLQTNLI